MIEHSDSAIGSNKELFMLYLEPALSEANGAQQDFLRLKEEMYQAERDYKIRRYDLTKRIGELSLNGSQINIISGQAYLKYSTFGAGTEWSFADANLEGRSGVIENIMVNDYGVIFQLKLNRNKTLAGKLLNKLLPKQKYRAVATQLDFNLQLQ